MRKLRNTMVALALAGAMALEPFCACTATAGEVYGPRQMETEYGPQPVETPETEYGPQPMKISEEELYRTAVLLRYEEYLGGSYNAQVLSNDGVFYHCQWADKVESNVVKRLITWATEGLVGKELDEEAYGTYLARIMGEIEVGMAESIAAQASYTTKRSALNNLESGAKVVLETVTGVDILKAVKPYLEYSKGALDELDAICGVIEGDAKAELVAASTANYEQKRIVLEAIRDNTEDKHLISVAEKMLQVNAYQLYNRLEGIAKLTTTELDTYRSANGIPGVNELLEFLGKTARENVAPLIKKHLGDAAAGLTTAAGWAVSAIPSVIVGFKVGGELMSVFVGDDVEMFREMKAMDEIGDALNRAFQGAVNAAAAAGSSEAKFAEIERVVALGQGLIYARLRGECCGLEALQGSKHEPDNAEEVRETVLSYLSHHYAALNSIFPKSEIKVAVTARSASQAYTWEDGVTYFTCSITRPMVTVSKYPEAEEKINGSEAWTELYGQFQQVAQSMEQNSAGLTRNEMTNNYSSSYEVSLTDVYATAEAISIWLGEYSYSAGAAHPIYCNMGYTFDLKDGSVLTLDSILDESNENAREQLIGLFTTELQSMAAGTYDGPQNAEGSIRKVFDGDGYVTAGNIWRFAENGMIIAFPPYAIASYAAGTIEVVVPYTSLKGIVRQKYLPSNRTGETAEGECVVKKTADIIGAQVMEQYGEKSELALTMEYDRAYDVYAAETYNSDGYRGELYFYTNCMNLNELVYLPAGATAYQMEWRYRRRENDYDTERKIYVGKSETGELEQVIIG